MARTLLTGGTVWAGAGCVPREGWLLLDGDRIASVGELGSPPPAADTVADLTGAHVLPGFVDSHVHLTTTAWQSRGIDGSQWQSVDDALAAVRAAASADPDSPWLLCWNARPFAWPQRRLPSAVELDAAAPGRRVLISGLDLHRGSVSTAALPAIGRVSSGQPDDVVRDRRGRPTGELWEQAYGEVLAHALADTEDYIAGNTVEEHLGAELRRCLTLGITHAHEAYVAPQHHERMQRAAAPTPLRERSAPAGATVPRLSWSIGAAEGLLTPVRGPADAPPGRYGASGREVKLFLDGGDRCAVCLPGGALGRLTARAIRQAVAARHPGPLRDALRRRSRFRGRELMFPYLRYDHRVLAAILAEYLAAGIRPRMHALGNLAARQAATALRTIGAPAGAAVIDHLTLLDPATTDLVAASGAWAVYQPGFLATFGPQIVGGGTDRYLGFLAGRQLLDAGAALVLASDHPAGPLEPLGNLRSAVHRWLPDGTPVQLGQALTPVEAVRAATVTAAASLGAPGAGGLSAGEIADLVVCDGDPCAVGSRVVQTWIGGHQAWHRTG